MFVLETIATNAGPTVAIALPAVAGQAGHLPLAAAGARLGVALREATLFNHLQAWDATWPAIAAIGARTDGLDDLVVRTGRATDSVSYENETSPVTEFVPGAVAASVSRLTAALSA